ncbi:hypothetical protein SK128_027715 [Halocaridina rubra]|uniref:Dipeptidase n=1 Tax=Halocaridina rubra TaxID=373956 RepID=A0AAN8WXX3_HALRR
MSQISMLKSVLRDRLPWRISMLTSINCRYIPNTVALEKRITSIFQFRAECSDSNSDIPPNAPGVTPYGKSMIEEMNRVGLLVDLSHSAHQTALDVLNISRAPVIFSHSAVSALCDIERNVPNDVLQALAVNGGVVMVSFYNTFLTCGNPATVQDVRDHINHIRAIAGVDHIGIGAGYDGINSTPKGLEDTSKYPELFAEFLKDPSWTAIDLKKLAGLNILRVLSRVDEVRDALSSESPMEDIIPIHDVESLWPCRYKFSNVNTSDLLVPVVMQSFIESH